MFHVISVLQMSVHATHFHWEIERVRHYFFKIGSLYINHKKCSYKPLKIRFHCHAINTAQKNKLETIQWKKCHKRLIYKQFVQVSGLCDPQFPSYFSRTIAELCMETPWCVQFWYTNMATGNQQNHLQFTFTIKALSFHFWKSMTW